MMTWLFAAQSTQSAAHGYSMDRDYTTRLWLHKNDDSHNSWLHNDDSHRMWQYKVDDSHNSWLHNNDSRTDHDYTRMMILTQIVTTQQWFSQIVTNRWFWHRSWLHNGDDSHINHDYTMVIILTQIVTTWFSHRSWLHNDNDSHKNCDYTTTIVTTPDCDYTTTILTQIMTTQHHGSHIATQPPQFCDIDFEYPLAGSQFSYCRSWQSLDYTISMILTKIYPTQWLQLSHSPFISPLLILFVLLNFGMKLTVCGWCSNSRFLHSDTSPFIMYLINFLL